MDFSSRIPNSLVGVMIQFIEKKARWTLGNSLSHCLYTHTPLVREEYENLLLRIILVIREEVELTAAV